MRNSWISWAVVASLAGGPLALPVMVEAQQSVTGTWTGTARGVAGLQPFEEDFAMVLVQHGQKVTGTFSRKFEAGAKAKTGRERTGMRVSGTLTGDGLSLTIAKVQTWKLPSTVTQ